MMEFLKSKFDNMSLFVALMMMSGMIIHFIHHSADVQALAWAETTFTTILGAYIGLTQAHRVMPKTNGNGSSSDAPIAPTPTSPSPVPSASTPASSAPPPITPRLNNVQ